MSTWALTGRLPPRELVWVLGLVRGEQCGQLAGLHDTELAEHDVGVRSIAGGEDFKAGRDQPPDLARRVATVGGELVGQDAFERPVGQDQIDADRRHAAASEAVLTGLTERVSEELLTADRRAP